MSEPTEQTLFEKFSALTFGPDGECEELDKWEKICAEHDKRLADAEKRMMGIRNILEHITPSIAQEAVILMINAAIELTTPQQETSHE